MPSDDEIRNRLSDTDNYVPQFLGQDKDRALAVYRMYEQLVDSIRANGINNIADFVKRIEQLADTLTTRELIYLTAKATEMRVCIRPQKVEIALITEQLIKRMAKDSDDE